MRRVLTATANKNCNIFNRFGSTAQGKISRCPARAFSLICYPFYLHLDSHFQHFTRFSQINLIKPETFRFQETKNAENTVRNVQKCMKYRQIVVIYVQDLNPQTSGQSDACASGEGLACLFVLCITDEETFFFIVFALCTLTFLEGDSWRASFLSVCEFLLVFQWKKR